MNGHFIKQQLINHL